ncbi:YbaN family protein [Aquabacter sp. CN5-332]|uniref:YbaN family protein n=1 Tax=Aquabacter sp. CN5-332 TaxID=3156608 RepID=UPI0032B4E1BE
MQVIWRRTVFATGCLFLILGAIGMVVPMLPGTVFLILAAWCFARTSPRFEAWLVNHRYLGPSVRRWQETGAIPLPVKLLALTSFVGTWTGSWYVGAPSYVLIPLAILFVVLAAFMVTRPSR